MVSAVVSEFDNRNGSLLRFARYVRERDREYEWKAIGYRFSKSKTHT
jgi:hypothetical protein